MSTDPTLIFPTQAAFETWLRANHDESDGIWLQIGKQGVASVTYAEAVDVALCYGWIDGQKRALDERYWLQRFTPRRPKSTWSKINCDKATALIARKKMRAPGLEQVERAKSDGRWDAAYPSPKKATVPDDLERALAKNKKAREFFAELDGANRYAILYRLHTARSPAARAKKLVELVGMLTLGKTIHPPRKKR